VERQRGNVEMVASENFVPRAVLECQGSVLTNKYAEGYPGRRFYAGCDNVNVTEQIAINRAEHVNVQPHSGTQANNAAYHAMLEPGDRILGLASSHGGHLSHRMNLNVSGRLYRAMTYGVDRRSGLIDMDAVAQLARRHRPEDDRARLVLLSPPARFPPLPSGPPTTSGRR
jgi:glycine hydroxymethyltransferase